MIYFEYQFEQLITKYTRIAVTTNERNEEKATKSLIDQFATTKPMNIFTADILRIGMADHYMIFGTGKLNARKFREIKARIIETRNLSKYNKTSFRNDLSMINWQTILDPVSENLNASTFRRFLNLS